MSGKKRTSRPEHFLDERTFDLEIRTGKPFRWFYAGLKTQCDREGRFVWNPYAIKRDVLPFDAHDVADMLDTLARSGLVLRYAAGGRLYGALPGWEQDQHINAKETSSTIPPPARSDVARWQAITVAAGLATDTAGPSGPSGPSDSDPVTGSPRVDDASLTGEARVNDSDVESVDACETSSDIPPDPGGSREEPERSQNGVHPASSRNGNGLGDYSRVNDPSVTGNSRVGTSLTRAGFVSAVDLDLASSGEKEGTTNPPGSEISSATLRRSHSLTLPGFHDETLPATTRGQRAAQALPAIRGRRTVEAIRDRLAQVLAEIQTGARTHLQKEQRGKLATEIVFGYWMKVFNHPKAILVEGDKREATITRRYFECEEDLSALLWCLDGARKDPSRDRETGQIYDGLQTIFRDRGQVERFAEKMPGYRNGQQHPVAAHYARIFAETQAIAATRDAPSITSGTEKAP